MTTTLELPVWKKTDKYSMTLGDHTISKVYVEGVEKHILWLIGKPSGMIGVGRPDKMMGIFLSEEEAQEAAK